jgi:hypothetical protein
MAKDLHGCVTILFAIQGEVGDPEVAQARKECPGGFRFEDQGHEERLRDGSGSTKQIVRARLILRLI